jgi:hypothetical protein
MGQYDRFKGHFQAFLATYIDTKDQFWLTVAPHKGVLGLPPHLMDNESVTLVLGARFRHASLHEDAVGQNPCLFVDLTFSNGPWTRVTIPLAAVLTYGLSGPPEASTPAVGAWWAVFSGGLQASPRRPTLLDAQTDAVSGGYAEWVTPSQKIRITQPGVSIRHSPSPNDVRVVQEFDKAVGGDNVIRVDFGQNRRPPKIVA